MPEAKLRKRKADSQKTSSKDETAPEQAARPEQTENDFDFLDGATISKYVKILWIPILLAFGAFMYLNPSVMNDLVGMWIESEDLQAKPSTSVPGFQDFGFAADVEKRDAVVAAFKHAWRAYERDAMGDDEYHPISRKGTNLTKAGGIGYTVIDSIDTMLLMGLEDDYKRARYWVENKLSFEQDADFSTFEAPYHLSGKDKLYLDKAVDLADRILPAFNTPVGLPYPSVNLAKRVGVPDSDLPQLVSTAEVSTLQLEFRYLSELTENEEYWDKAENVMHVIKAGRMPHGLASIYLHVQSGKFVPSAIRLGSRGDSYYEYLLKQYLQTNQTEAGYKDMYDEAMTAVHDNLIQKSPYARLTYTAELIPEQTPTGELQWRLTPKQDHLVCFFGGSLMLGATITGASVSKVAVPPGPKELTANGKRDWDDGVELVKTCMATHDTATGLSPEIVYFRVPNDNMDEIGYGLTPSDWYIKGARRGEFPPYDARYILRPETVESLFLAFRLTGDQKYRKWGWDIFQSIEKHCRVKTGGYASIINVDESPSRMEDKMETFLMSETLKYLYLLFADADVLPLDKYVLNTEVYTGGLELELVEARGLVTLRVLAMRSDDICSLKGS
ncbi:mannosyl-oligosaccharide alpha-1,2-mannosidase [Marasmius crinis-equi]|uniref:alpha-1,2-Mannosidase n=1 Tax=Marasmius crinis-equi TaxID=585013 RepID=A0ABR3FKN5_9AGAR